MLTCVVHVRIWVACETGDSFHRTNRQIVLTMFRRERFSLLHLLGAIRADVRIEIIVASVALA